MSNKKDELYNIKKNGEMIHSKPVIMHAWCYTDPFKWEIEMDIFYQIRYKSVLDEDWRWYGGEVYLCGMA